MSDRLRTMMAELANGGADDVGCRGLAALEHSDVGVDPRFTARVLSALPAAPMGQGMSPCLRLAVVASAYVIAGVAGWVALGGQADRFLQWAHTAHGLLAEVDGRLGFGAALGLGALTLVVVAFAWRSTHTTPA